MNLFYGQLMSRKHGVVPYTSPAVSGVFKIGANVGGIADYAQSDPELVDLVPASRGFSKSSSFSTQANLDSNGFPTEDFLVLLPMIPFSSSSQTLKGFAGCTGTFSLSGTGFSLANVTAVGNNTTFDLIVAANNPATNQVQIIVNSSKRVTTDSPGTGCTAFIVKQPGFSIADTTVWMPNFVTYLSQFSTLRMMDLTGVNGDLNQILSTDRPSLTKKVHTIPITAGSYSPEQIAVENLVALANSVGANMWMTLPVKASDALVTAIANVIFSNLNTGKYCVVEVGNENWNFAQPLTNYWGETQCLANNGWSYQFAQTRLISSASRSGSVITITTAANHSYTAGQTIGVVAIGLLTQNTTTVLASPAPTATTFAVDDGGTGSGAVSLGGGSSVMTLTGTLNTYDGNFDQNVNMRRAWMRRTAQVSSLFQTVYGGAFASRIRVVYMDQPGFDLTDPVSYLSSQFGTPSSYIYGIGNASYYFLDATPYGGNNLRNVDTFGGNTPPSIADYNAAATITAANNKIDTGYDRVAVVARQNGLVPMQYECGPDITGVPPNSSLTATIQRKFAAMADVGYPAIYKSMFAQQEAHGFQEVCVYTAAIYAGDTNEYGGYNITTDFAVVSQRLQGLSDYVAQARTGPTRNLVASTGTTVIGGAQEVGHYSGTTNINDLDLTQYVISSQTTRSFNLVLNINATDQFRQANLVVNGVAVHQYDFTTIGTNLNTTSVSISLTAGLNVIGFSKVAGGYIGQIVNINSLTFS